MSENASLDKKTIKLIILSRRAESFLAPYFTNIEPFVDADNMYLRGTIECYGNPYNITIPIDKSVTRVMERLKALEPAVIGGSVRIDDVKLFILLAFSSFKLTSILYKNHKKDIKRVIGLAVKSRKHKKNKNGEEKEEPLSINEKKLLSLLIFKKVVARKMLNGTFQRRKARGGSSIEIP